MAVSWDVVVSYIILIPFIIINLLISVGFLFQKYSNAFLSKILISKKENKEKYKFLIGLIQFLIWVIVGIYAVLSLDNPLSTGGLVIFIAFRSGLKLGQKITFGAHDVKLVKSNVKEQKNNKIIANTVIFSIIFELTFIITWGILYKYLSNSIKSSFGLEVNILFLILWFSGIIFGTIFSLIKVRFSEGFLLKNEIGLTLLISGESLRSKMPKKPKFLS